MEVTGVDINSLFSQGIPFVFKIGFILFVALYFIFSLVVIRQVNSMSETIKTEGSVILKTLSIFHALLALGAVVLFIGFF